MEYTLESPPIPFDESLITDKFIKEPGEYIPKNGFIQDFVMYTRGIETPTEFSVWAALYTISALLKRDAWMKWFPKPLFPNLFVIFIAPPRICAKSTCVEIGDGILQLVPSCIPNKYLSAGKQINTHRSKATPEVLFDLMQPRKIDLSEDEKEQTEDEKVKQFVEHADKERIIPTTEKETAPKESLKTISEMSLIISELTTFLGKQKYNESLVDVLTYLYDCPNKVDEATRTYGAKSLDNVYLTFFGATTPDAFALSLPETAFGGGFLSRTILVTNYIPTRSYPVPKQLSGAPNEIEIAKRLAWIASTALGEYTFSQDAFTEYVKWYHKFKKDLVGDPLADAKARMDTNLIKLSLLIRAQRYEPGNIITKQDFLDAQYLLESAFMRSKDFYAGATGSEYYQTLITITKYLQKQQTPDGAFRPVSRAQLLREFTVKKISPESLTHALTHLLQMEQIKVFSNKKEIFAITDNPTDTIVYSDIEGGLII